ncbi:MAG: NAD(P)/FAD-dependent oxidoreductase [Candidatus Zixiibacteriota bacterium]
MNRRFDVIVIGAGPAGGLAALTAARAGCHTVLIEKHARIGEPLCCAEGISTSGLTDNVELDPTWVDATIERCYLETAGGAILEFSHPKAGFVLSRRRFEQGLADRAAAAGCEVMTNAEAIGLLDARDGRFGGVRVQVDGHAVDVNGEVIIAADGIESLVARWAGMDTTLSVDHLDSGAQLRLDNIPDLDPSRMEFYFGTQVAPGGYAWVFPKGDRSANVGLALAPSVARGRKAMSLLLDFVRRRMRGATIGACPRMVGGIPEFSGRRFMLANNVLVTGDAARLLDSLTGAGIANALSSGRMAAEASIEYLADGRSDLRLLRRYPERWMAARGRQMRYFLWARQIFLRMTDADMDAAIRSLQGQYHQQTFTHIDPIETIKRALRARPALLRLARHLVW